LFIFTYTFLTKNYMHINITINYSWQDMLI
jgi:hypothetical protein